MGSDANANTAITAASVSDLTSYGTKDVKTDASGIVYFWLPMTGNSGTDEETVSIEANSKQYAATYVRGDSPVAETLSLTASIADGNIGIIQYNDKYTVNAVTYDYNEVLTITGSSNSNIVTVMADGTFSGDKTVQIALKGVDISNAASPFQLGENAVVALTISGENKLTCTYTGSSAGIYAGLYVSPSAAITIADETDDATDSLTANGGDWGAGIGGSYIDVFDYSKNVAGSITINSGIIKANGGDSGAGIGGGRLRTGGNIEISGGEVTANGGESARYYYLMTL